MRIETEVKLDFKDVLIRPKRSTLSSRKEVDITRSFKFPHAKQTWNGVPIIAANMDTTGTFEMFEALKDHQMMTALQKHFSEADLIHHFSQTSAQNFSFYSMGIGDADYKKFVDVYHQQPISKVCVDVANGYSETFVQFIEKLRKFYPDLLIMAGNVVTGEMAEQLILSGADIVKVGIGPGSVCTTRKMTGVGYPQLSAIIECADAAHGVKGLICADGGCTVPGDLAKAFGAGADYVMLGGMLAGHDESAGDIVMKNGEMFKQFYGMSSDTAMNKYAGGVAEYRASEGKTVQVPYRGPVASTVQGILGGIRSACTYTGAPTLKELSKRTTFVRVTQQINEVFGKS
jgi:GMP reductase